MTTRYIGRDSHHPTGSVSIFMQDGEPGYQIENEVAWDYLASRPALNELARRWDFPESLIDVIRHLRRKTLTGEAGYSREIVAYSYETATIIKANQAELLAIVNLLGFKCSNDQTLAGIRHRMEILLVHFPARAIVVTRGAEGTIVLDRNGEFVLSTPVTNKRSPHPVGAGDACSAGILFGFTLGWDIHNTMELANRMGADVAAHPSVTPPLSSGILSFAHALLHDSLA